MKKSSTNWFLNGKLSSLKITFKLFENHMIFTINKIKGNKYFKCHDSYNYDTNNYVAFKNQI